MTNRYPLIVDTSDSNKIKELPDGDNLQLSGNSIVGAVNITASGALTIGSVVAATSITIGGTAISSVATSGSYTDLTNTPTAVSTFTNDSNYVTTGSNISVFANNAGYLTTVAYADLTSTPTTLAGYGITVATDSIIAAANSAIQPADNVSTLTNDSGYITLTQVQSGDISIDVTNSGDLIGSVFSQDSTLMVDAILSSFNLDGTIRGHVTPAQSEFWDLGTTDNLFRHAYLSGTVNANTAGVHTGDTIGSVFGDDSTVLVDGINNKIVGAVDTTSLRTSDDNIALGYTAGSDTQGSRAVAIGYRAGRTSQGSKTVAIGEDAGYTGQGGSAVAVGYTAGRTTQGNYSVAIGQAAGGTTQGQYGVAIGQAAGNATQGQYGVAIGNQAGYSNQAANSIVINATGNILNNTQADAFVVKPIRGGSGTTTLMYDASSGEITHTATPAQQTMIGSVQQISGPGAIDVTSYITEITTTGADAYTLADGVAGQIKIISMIVDGGDATITPTTLATGTTITMADVNDNITLLYGTNGWANTANQGAIIA